MLFEAAFFYNFFLQVAKKYKLIFSTSKESRNKMQIMEHWF